MAWPQATPGQAMASGRADDLVLAGHHFAGHHFAGHNFVYQKFMVDTLGPSFLSEKTYMLRIFKVGPLNLQNLLHRGSPTHAGR